MKTRCLATLILAAFALMLAGQEAKEMFPIVKGPYIGQKTPGTTPEIFAPYIISTGLSEVTCSFTPEGDEMIYPLVYRKPHSDKVCSSMVTSRMKNGFWSASVGYR